VTSSDRAPYRSTLIWLAVLVVSALAVRSFFPRAFPLAPRHWTVTREQAREISLEQLRDLGPLPESPYVVAQMDDDARLEYRLLEGLRGARGNAIRASDLPNRTMLWRITVYPRGAQPGDWRLQAELGLDGQVLALRRHFKDTDAGGTLDDAEAIARARAFLASRGIDLARYEAPTVRRKDLEKRTDLFVRFASREQALGDRLLYGLEVDFAGDQLAGFEHFQEDPERQQITVALQPVGLFAQLAFFSTFLALPFVAPIFLRRYHLGEIGVRRGLHILGICLGLGALFFAQVSAGSIEGTSFGVLTRRQVSWIWGAQMVVLFILPIAIAAFLSWSVGESLCRERWGRKLAAFDALFQGSWANRTVALSSLRGYAAGFAIAAGTLGLVTLAERAGAMAPFAFQLGPFWNQARYPGVALVMLLAIFGLYQSLFGRLFLLPLLVRRAGRTAGGAVTALITTFVFFAPVILLPLKAAIPVWIAYSAATVVLFVTTDLLTTFLAGFTAAAVLSAYPLAAAPSASVQFQGWIGLLAGAVPLILSARYLVSDRVFVYRYEDVPPHVRRIAERERQRVELETARNIQSSILPQLPPSLNGVELAHSYLPATEVGGDFYDVLGLEDGRVAVAVGDVAGHGVSSGLVMSMAKSALAVQVTFDPAVEAVFRTLNRMVHQSARKRLLATLCYALVDPRRREMTYASAGHLFPYRVTTAGRVEVLESVAYPLGVRPSIEVHPRVARLEAGDTVFLCSDGLIEACKEGSDEPFGFDRLESILSQVAGNGAGVVRDRVLAAVEEWLGDAPREDDLTLLVLRLA
jgi:hypothetical protein